MAVSLVLHLLCILCEPSGGSMLSGTQYAPPPYRFTPALTDQTIRDIRMLISDYFFLTLACQEYTR
jgi:hypothetical protein